MTRPDTAAIRRRSRTHWGARPHTYATLAAAFDVCALLAHVARLERHLSVMQAQRAADGDGTAARAGAGQLAGAEARRAWGRRARRAERLRDAAARAAEGRAA